MINGILYAIRWVNIKDIHKVGNYRWSCPLNQKHVGIIWPLWGFKTLSSHLYLATFTTIGSLKNGDIWESLSIPTIMYGEIFSLSCGSLAP